MRTLAIGCLTAMTVGAAPALAAPTTVLPGSRQQHALAVRVDGRNVSARACAAGAPCAADGGQRFTIAADAKAESATVEMIELEGGRRVAHISAALTSGAGSWSLILAASDGKLTPEVEQILVGHVAVGEGMEGEQRSRVLLKETVAGGVRLVVGRRYDNASVCGRPSVMSAQALDPSDMRWRPSATRSLSPAEIDGATALTATYEPGDFGLVRPQLLHGVVASSAKGHSRGALTDRKLDTGWVERAAGDGRGEFLVMTASSAVAVTGFEWVVKPTGASPLGAAPRTFFIATSERVYAITMPDDAWQRDAGARYSIALPEPVHSDCFAVVLGDGFVSADVDDVTVAELRAKTRFDGETLDSMVRALDSEDADPARALLTRSGAAGVQASIAGYAALGVDGRRRALEVIDGGECDVVTPFLVDRVLGAGEGADFDPDFDGGAKHARARLRDCKNEARAVLSKFIREGAVDDRRVWAARELGSVAPRAALEVVLEVLEQGSTAPAHSGRNDDVRRGLRRALSAAAQHKRAHDDVTATLAADRFGELSSIAQIDLLRAIGAALKRFPGAGQALTTTLGNAPSMRTRFLLLEPAAHLATSGDRAAMQFVRDTMRSDESPHVRARAAQVSGAVAELVADLEATLSDDAPRVREAALLALDKAPKLTASGEARVVSLLEHDVWTFVRVGAATTLAKRSAPGSSADEALARVVIDRDGPPRLRAASLRALGKRKSTGVADTVLDVADNPREAVHIRVAAISALGDMCHRDAVPFLYKLALRAGYQQLPYDQPLGLAALSALGDIHPADLHEQLAPLFVRTKTVPPQVRAIARDVLERKSTCR